MDRKEFESEWKESMDGYEDVHVSMTGSWQESHVSESRYMRALPFVSYEFISKDTYPDRVKLITKDGKSVIVELQGVSSIL